MEDTDFDFDGAIDDLNDCGRLSDWEADFLDDMLRRREENPDWAQRLSEKQSAKIRELWERHCDA